MKTSVPAPLPALGVSALGVLALVLAACFNPITAIPPTTGNSAVDPFAIDVYIGKDTCGVAPELGIAQGPGRYT